MLKLSVEELRLIKHILVRVNEFELASKIREEEQRLLKNEPRKKRILGSVKKEWVYNGI